MSKLKSRCENCRSWKKGACLFGLCEFSHETHTASYSCSNWQNTRLEQQPKRKTRGGTGTYNLQVRPYGGIMKDIPGCAEQQEEGEFTKEVRAVLGKPQAIPARVRTITDYLFEACDIIDRQANMIQQFKIRAAEQPKGENDTIWNKGYRAGKAAKIEKLQAKLNQCVKCEKNYKAEIAAKDE